MKTILILALATSTASAGIVADTLFMECRGENLKGQVAVASVIVTRSERTGRTLEEVCLRRKQFSCWNGNRKKPVPTTKRERELMKRFLLIERDMKRGTFKPSGSWTHYYNPDKASPSWGEGMTNKTRIGNHLFGITN